MPSTSRLSTSSAPTLLPGPVSTWKAPPGKPPSRRHSYSFSAVKNPWCEGFSTTAFPATRAPPAGPPASAIGKLKGLMIAHTP